MLQVSPARSDGARTNDEHAAPGCQRGGQAVVQRPWERVACNQQHAGTEVGRQQLNAGMCMNVHHRQGLARAAAGGKPWRQAEPSPTHARRSLRSQRRSGGLGQHSRAQEHAPLKGKALLTIRRSMRPGDGAADCSVNQEAPCKQHRVASPLPARGCCRARCSNCCCDAQRPQPHPDNGLARARPAALMSVKGLGEPRRTRRAQHA